MTQPAVPPIAGVPATFAGPAVLPQPTVPPQSAGEEPEVDAEETAPAPPLSVREDPRWEPPTRGLRLELLVAWLRPRLTRTIAVINGKGGQGKTSVVCNLAVLLAEVLVQSGSKRRVLVVDLDPQANTGLDLGHQDREGDDGGEGLEDAVLKGRPLHVIRDVRPQLDVVPSGDSIELLGSDIMSRVTRDGDTAWLNLALALAKIAHEYDWILIDCPPGEANIQKLALAAARYAVIPAHLDAASRRGLAKVSRRFEDAGRYNPDLDLLGVVLFDFQRRMSRPKDGSAPEPIGQVVRQRRRIEAVLRRVGSDAPVFEAFVRSADLVAEQCRDRGQTVFELSRSTDGVQWWELRAGRKNGTVLASDRAEAVGQDYEDLGAEIVDRVLAIEQLEATA
ncbi:ParA family protein [Kitasatospora sp. NPDC059160]|uniref:ParA family protein n=1 Tax=Kitasatospora sp. NPDC059160 TaxID=3346748 RepID=UPI003699850E